MRPHVELNDAFAITALYTAFSTLHSSDYFFGGEVHDFWEIVFVTEGEIGVTAGKDVFYLEKGKAILHTPNEFHNLWSAKNAEAGILIFTFSARHFPLPPSRIFEVKDLSLPFSILSDIKASFCQKNDYAIAIREGMESKAGIAIKRLELFLLELMNTATQGVQIMGNSQSAQNYATVVRYLEENLHRPLSVTEIAKACNMGEVNLKKTFSRYAGMGVMSYFNRLKIHAAIEMLERGATVRECAESLGFLNQNYFSTVFARIMGKSPKSYKG
jgi:AraC-like DNA-binding protein